MQIKNIARFIAFLLLSSCSYHVEKIPELDDKSLSSGAQWFAGLNVKVFGPKCARCHGAEWVGDYDATFAIVGKIAARIQSSDASFQMPPPGATPLTPGERAAVLDWIARGAPKDPGGTPPPPPPPPPPALNFASVKAEVFDKKCLRCHDTDFDTFEHTSPLLKDIEFRVQAMGTDDQMPPARATQLTEDEKKQLLDWIHAGAPET